MGLSNRKRANRKFVPPKLMLTSMMDMFTIILVFLIFSFSNQPDTIKLNKQLELPRSATESENHSSIRITLTRSELMFGKEIISEVRANRILELTMEQPENSILYKRLKTYRDKHAETIERGGSTPSILFLCDKSHSFKTINAVIKTAGLAGYPNFQFAVLEKK